MKRREAKGHSSLEHMKGIVKEGVAKRAKMIKKLGKGDACHCTSKKAAAAGIADVRQGLSCSFDPGWG